jgi:hypothetical protein
LQFFFSMCTVVFHEFENLIEIVVFLGEYKIYG